MPEYITKGGSKFVLTHEQIELVKSTSDREVLVLWEKSANKKYQIGLVKKTFKYKGRQIPNNTLIIFDRNNRIWISSDFPFMAVHNRSGETIKRQLIPKNRLKYLKLSCYDYTWGAWADTTIGRGSLLSNVYDAISELGVDYTEHVPEEIKEYEYKRLMKHDRKKRKVYTIMDPSNPHYRIDGIYR